MFLVQTESRIHKRWRSPTCSHQTKTKNMGPKKNPPASTAASSNATTDGQVVMDAQNVAPAIGQVAMDSLNDVPVIN
eukprot:1401767-Rhodomonas_salina.2